MLAPTNQGAIFLTGPAGCGKSALLAQARPVALSETIPPERCDGRSLRASPSHFPAARPAAQFVLGMQGRVSLPPSSSAAVAAAAGRAAVFFHFASVHGAVSSLRFILRRLCTELMASFRLEIPLPEGGPSLCEAFHKCLVLAATKADCVVILIDGIESLDQEGTDLTWVPNSLPAAVHIVLSGPWSSKWLKRLNFRERTSSVAVMRLDPLLLEERALFLTQALAEVSSRANPTMTALRPFLESAAAGSPLYLRLAVAEVGVSAARGPPPREGPLLPVSALDAARLHLPCRGRTASWTA